MGANAAAINIMHFPVQLAITILDLLQLPKDVIPDATFAPAIEAAVDCLPFAIALWQIAPGRTGFQDPEYAVNDRAMIQVRTSGLGFLRREQGFQLLPLFIR